MRKTACTVLLLGGCSFGMKTVDPKWDGSEEPECSSSYGPVLADSLAAAALATVATIGIDEENDEMVLGGALGAIAFGIAGLVGEQNASRCESARAQYRVGTAIGKSSARAQREEREEAAPPKSVIAPVAPELRGFYCTASSATSAGSCTRAKSDCERARDILASAVDDLSDCTLVETAQCFAASNVQRCFPTAESCGSAETKVAESSKAGISSACTETR